MTHPGNDLLEPMRQWSPPAHWRTIRTIDAHTGGEPLRIIVSGLPELPGDTILARRRHVMKNLDDVRRALMWEPRGHREMYGCVITPPVTGNADFGVIFLHTEGYSTMCGHGIIAVTMVAVETGLVKKQEGETVVRINSPAGLVTAHARVTDGRVRTVYFHNVPSFVVGLDQSVDVPGLGVIHYDLAFGGAFYAYVDAAEIGLACAPNDHAALVEKGMMIKRAVAASRPIVHPFEDDLSFLYGTIFIAPPAGAGVDSRNVCVFADGELDRSPTGTGVSGRMAIHYARNQIRLNQAMVIESIIGSRFIGKVVRTTTFGPYQAVIPEVEGAAFICGRHEFLIDPADPLRHGFLL
jgi:trans-L-3-hydroxyproline dehydratase